MELLYTYRYISYIALALVTSQMTNESDDTKDGNSRLIQGIAAFTCLYFKFVLALTFMAAPIRCCTDTRKCRRIQQQTGLNGQLLCCAMMGESPSDAELLDDPGQQQWELVK